MPGVDGILTMNGVESRCSINGNTRDIVVPDEYHIFGVESDENVTRIPFICPKIVGDNVDLTGYSIYINYINGAGLGGIYVVDDVVARGDNITFSWLLSRNVTAKAGTVSYIICAKKSGTDTKVTNEWNTKIATGTVSSGIETYDTVVQQSSDVINKLLKLTQGQSAYDIAIDNGFVGTKAAWLESLKGKEGPKGDKGDDSLTFVNSYNDLPSLSEANLGILYYCKTGGILYMVNADKSAWIEIPYGMSFTSGYVDDTGYLHLQLNGEDIEGFTPFFVGFSGSGEGGGGGGGGSSASYSVTLKNSLDTRSLTVPIGVAANLKFKYTSLDSDESDDGSGIGTVTVNGATVASISIPQGENTLDVSSYLTAGTNTVKIKVENSEGTSRTLSYTVIVVELSIASNFDDSLIYSDAITFKYTPYGSVDKTVNFFVDGTAAGTESVSSSGRQLTKIFPAMSHGAHTIKVYATAVMDGNTITSNILTYDIVCIQNGQTSVIIASSYTKETATQGELVTIPFMVYNPSSQTSTVTLTIKSGSETYSTQTRSVGRVQETWSTRKYPTGSVTFEITCGSVTKSHTLTVTASTVNVQAVTNDLELYLSSAGRSNSESNPSVWKSGDITTTFTNVNWNTTGWIEDSDGDTALRLFGSATAEIAFKPFATDFRTYGKTIEIEFEVRDVNNRDAVVLSCLNGGIGIQITSDRAVMTSEQSSIECRFADEEKLRVSFTVESRNEHRLMSIYLNGILSGACQYPDNDNFQQGSPVNITIGSSLCGIDVYTIRSYTTALSYSEIRDNYIADTTDVSKKLELYNSNKIYDNYGNLSYDLVKTQIPVMTIIGNLPTAKGDKKSVRIIYEDPFNPSLNFDTANDDGDCTIDVQGTSSQWYVRKNWKLKFKNEHTHVTGMLPAKVFCMKADYAEATGTHNTQNANLIGTLYQTKTPPQETDSRVRTTVYGFPCVIYHKATESSTPVFNGKYNFNYDKGAENVYGFSADYPNAESWEFCNNTSDACLFHGQIGSEWGDDFEARYPDGDQDIQYFKTMHDWVVSTYQGGATGSALAESYTDADGTVHTTDNAAYRLAKFKKEFTDHFDKDFCLLYYIYTFVMLMVDQRAKNMFLTTWDHVHWQPWFYDNDTCLGINNEGALVFDYYHEDGDQLAGANVYNGATSALWVNFKMAFADEIKSLYQSLRNNGKLTPEVVYQYFITNGAKKWSESIYNEDAVFKYISMLISDNDATNLDQIRGSGESHLRYFIENRFKYCDSKWYTADYANDYISLRIYTPVDDSGAPKTGLAVTPNANIKVTPFSNMYVGVKYKANGTLQQKRATKNTETTFTAPSEVFNDTETAIYGASELSSIGDLAPLYCGSVNVSKATKLTKLKVGDAKSGYSNTNLTSLSVGTNKLLSVIDVRNCPNLTAPLALANCPNIEEIYADGSGITGVELPPSGYLKTIYLPNTITNLTLRNQTHIETFSCAGYTNLTTLRIENCVNIPIQTIVNEATNLSRVRLLDVSLTCDDETLINKLMACGGLDETGNNTEKSIVTGSIHITSIKPSTLSAIQAYYPNLTVTYDTLLVEYTVKFKNWDGTVLDTQTVISGQDAVEPISAGRIQTPTRPSTAQYTYTYTGWSGTVETITSARTLTAQYSSTVRSYTIRFMNGSTLLQSSVLNYGEMPVFNGANPDGTGSSIFSGWSPEISAVVGPQDYLAQFATPVVPSSVKTFADCSWLEIKAVADAGHMNSSNQWCITRNGIEEVWWDIGDEKNVTMSDGTTVTFMIYAFNHDVKASDGVTKAPLTIGTKELMPGEYVYNTAYRYSDRSYDLDNYPTMYTKNLSWKMCELRTVTLPVVFSKLPSELQAIICEVNKKAMKNWRQEEATEFETVVDKLFIPSFSECEVPNASYHSDIKVEKCKDIYAKEGSKYPTFGYSDTRRKRRPDKLTWNGLDIYSYWWTRTVCVARDYVLIYDGSELGTDGDGNPIVYNSYAGYINGGDANIKRGILLMFCI